MNGGSSRPGCFSPQGWRAGVIRAAGPPTAYVVKLGGSLLRRADWPSLVSALVAADAPPCLLVVGGGPLVDGLRAIDAAAPRPGGLMHCLAIDAMRLTARLVADAVNLPIVEAAPRGGHGVLDVPAWLAADGRRAAALPEGWGVTSDSIAALVTVHHGRGLVLAKTVPPPCPDSLAALSAAGWVDEHFPVVAEPLPTIGWCAPLAGKVT